jgi:septal ring factor EnvC (AmiA/AmiB activator)
MPILEKKMNDDTFARVVAEDVKNRATQPQKEYLKLPENWSRWQRALSTLENNLNDQLEGIHTYEQEQIKTFQTLGKDGVKLIAEATAEHEARRKKIERFKFHVTNRLDEVTRMIAVGGEAIDERLHVVDFLRRAIEQHKAMMISYDLEPTPIDGALWAALDGRWEFDNLSEEDILSFS